MNIVQRAGTLVVLCSLLAVPAAAVAEETQEAPEMQETQEAPQAAPDVDAGEPAETTAPVDETVPSEQAAEPPVEAQQEAATPTVMGTIQVLGTEIESNPAGRTIGKVDRGAIEHTRGFDLKELVEETPGIFLKQGNGPRDVGISIRGSGAKVGFGVRNIKTYEDWFPTTQSDGLSRTDINDPHAYEGVDVLRGPSSSLYDNYAIGGVINFRSRRGRDIQGVDVGVSGGSFGYLNTYIHAGDQSPGMEYGLFGSYIAADGYIDHSDYYTVTQNFTLAFTPDDKRTFIVKFLNNDLKANVPSRLTLNEFRANSRDAGTTAVTGVGTVSAEQADQNREDRRTIIGARYEYAPNAQTGIRILGAYDVKDINQTFGTIGDNTNPNFHSYMDVTYESAAGGVNLTHYAGIFFNNMEQEASSFLNLADFNGTRGGLVSNTRGYHRNVGLRFREEIRWASRWTAIVGVGLERSEVNATVGPTTIVNVDRVFLNAAPEIALIYQHSPELQAHLRAATGYGIPGIGQLTTTPAGVAGNNTSLDPQRVYGLELGVNTTLDRLVLDVTGYYEWFFDELVTQASAAGPSFSTNAPRAEHRGVEVALHWFPAEGWRLSTAYTYNDHIYTNFQETIGPVPVATFDRENNKIPGVEPHILNARVAYDSPFGLGGWIEGNYLSGFYINNSNTLKTEPYDIYNINLHYDRAVRDSWIDALSLFAELQNIFDRDYMGSAVVVADLNTDTPATLATKRAFFAGTGRAVYGGVKVTF